MRWAWNEKMKRSNFYENFGYNALWPKLHFDTCPSTSVRRLLHFDRCISTAEPRLTYFDGSTRVAAINFKSCPFEVIFGPQMYGKEYSKKVKVLIRPKHVFGRSAISVCESEIGSKTYAIFRRFWLDGFIYWVVTIIIIEGRLARFFIFLVSNRN